MISLCYGILFSILSHVISYGFYGHDLIARQTWLLLNINTIESLCFVYEICNSRDFQTISVLPDLLKHKDRFMKYFDLHFFNNPIDSPPTYCNIDVIGAINQDGPNLLRAVKHLLEKFQSQTLSFQEISYFVHLLADLHQPFHITAYEKGGMRRKLCSTEDDQICWSLHALWDAEMLKLIKDEDDEIKTEYLENEFDLEEWCVHLNKYICTLYEYPDAFSIEDYVERYKNLSLYFVKMAAINTASILNSKFRRSPVIMTSLNSALDFEREISSIISELKQCPNSNETLNSRFNILQKQFKVKSSFLSGYQLKQLREKIYKLSSNFCNPNSDITDEVVSSNGNIAQRTIQLSSETSIDILSDSRNKIINLKNLSARFEVKDDVLVENVQNSTIEIVGAVNSFRINNVRNSNITLENICNGTVYIENINRCKLVISGDQIRIHESSDSDVFLYAKSSCILEDCEKLRFHPNASAIKKNNNEVDFEKYWKCVQDFGFNCEESFTYVNDLIDE